MDLKELQAASQTYHTIFENFLQKYTEAVQQQSFPISDARVITAASRPLSKSYPKTKLIALLGLIFGVSAGLVHSLVLKNFDRAIRRPRDVEQRLGLECIGLVPLINGGRQKPKPGKGLMQLVAANADPPAEGPNLVSKVLDDPFSHFSEALRSAKTTLDIMALTRPMQCIGVISAVPGEGKSTIAVNLANLFAGGARSTLLIDADMRNPELSWRLGTDAKLGLLELIAGLAPLDKMIRPVSKGTLAFLPTVLQQRIANSGDLLASERMRAILEQARAEFDQVIVDLPPLGPVSDARAISPLVDAFVVVVKWGHTRFDILEDALANFGVAADKIVGVVLNRVDHSALSNMDAHSHGYYYNKNYAKYGYTYSE